MRVWWTLWPATVAVGCFGDAAFRAGTLGQLSYLVVTVGAAVVAMAGARRQPSSRRFPWGCVAAALALSAIGDVIWYLIFVIRHVPPDVSFADPFWLASYVALAVGLSSLIVGGRGFRQVDLDGLTDIGSFVVLALVIVTRLGAVRDVISDSSFSVISRAAWTSYPILDAALLGVIAEAIVSRRLRTRAGVLLGCGVALWLAADFASLLIADASVISVWTDLGWMLGATTLAASAWPAGKTDPAHGSVPKVVRVTDARLAITFVPLLVPTSIEVWEFGSGRDANPLPMFAATVVLVALAYGRSTRLVQARNFQEAALEDSRRFYSALAENSSDAVLVVDKTGRILNDAPNLATMLGRPGISTIGMNGMRLVHPRDRDAARIALQRLASTHGVVIEAELRSSGFDGTELWFGVRGANLSDDPVVRGMVLNLRDITDRKRAEQQLSHKAFHDSLTGLANRALFHDRLEHALERTSRTGLEVAVVYLDLDGFKMINDSRGHEAGDQVLREVATRLTSTIRAIDTVSRDGGDEFAILIESSNHALDEAKTVAERVLQTLTAPFVVDDQQVVLSASIGITVGDVSSTASSMMRDADLAMYKAKTTGKGKWAVYESALRTAVLEQLELENDLRHALDRREFRLLYQPIIELKTSAIVGFEALLRWDHPRIGVIEPTTFIPIAESTGAIVAIGKWVLDEACRTSAMWRRTYPAAQPTMAVNLSVCQIATPEIVEHVATALKLYGLPASSLVLEMTESVLVTDAETASRRLADLRGLGVQLAIDDFGTGYSSLSYLRQFPIDILKIDKSFIHTISEQSPMPAIVRGLLDLAKTLGMKTVAEGIELEVQLDNLREQKCEYGQGYLFASPLNIGDAEALIADPRALLPTPV